FNNYISLDYEEKKVYTIAEVNVVGTETRDTNAIKSIVKLREGDEIILASDKIGRGIKSLWRLGIFSNVEILLDKIDGDDVYLTIKLEESPTLSRYEFKGIKKAWTDDLTSEVEKSLRIGGILSQNGRLESIENIKNFYLNKGYPNAQIIIDQKEHPAKINNVIAVFTVTPKDRMKISKITFNGNKYLSDRKLRKLMKETKKKGTIFKKSKFVDTDFKEDKKNILAHYNKLGYRDARILGDSLWVNVDNNLELKIDVNEGNQYVYRSISWKGNLLYTDQQLAGVLGLNKGDVFNEELLSKRLEFSLDGRDVSSLYMDNGYLFFQVTPTELSVHNDSIDLEMRIYEGPQATIDKVSIAGNDRTNENVIRRTIRTVPGDKFSRSNIIRSQRELQNLGYFNPENMDIQTPVNAERGTVDIEYTVEETPSDQLELSAGFGGFSGLIGTLGVSFNNFSINNITKKESWSPLPTGDGQRLSVRIQSNGRFFKSYNASFTDPWLGGKKPNSFTVGFTGSEFNNTQFGGGLLNILRGFIGLGSALKFPDDFFVSNTVVNIENIILDNFAGFNVPSGSYKNFNFNQTITRSSVDQPLFPRRGAKLSLSVQFTPPYSLFRGDNHWVVSSQERIQLIQEENLSLGPRQKLVDAAADRFINDIENGRKFEFLEYHKWRFDAEWYFNIAGKLVMATSAKMGYLGAYNNAIGIVPFERFEVGGDGLSNQNSGITGTDIIALRGYDLQDLDVNGGSTRGSAVIFNKFTVELRYPLSLNPTSTIYGTTFFQAGNAWNSFRDYNPFDLYRSVGVGLRVFLPMFGLLGFDYAFGLDKVIEGNPNPGLGELSKFSIILGFEPD
ncbi:MAG: POTRA domain-containing protein, partial [Saprospiraceae bacterium]